jgi:hypothetical protein
MALTKEQLLRQAIEREEAKLDKLLTRKQRPIRFPHEVFLHFRHRIPCQFIHEKHSFGYFEVGQLALAFADNLRFRHG